MHNKFFSFPLLAGILFLAACNRSTVSLEYTNAKDEIPQLGNLQFRFSKTLVNDSLLNSWDSSEYVSFEPKIPGRFRWEHGDELVFSPSKPLSPATDFKATLNREILRFSKIGTISNPGPILFHTPGLHLDNANASWVLQDENSNTALPQIDLFFNYPVDPAALKEKLLVEIGGQAVNYNLQTLSVDNKISLRLLNLKMDDKDNDVRIIVDKGVVPSGGTLGSPEKQEIRSVIPSAFALRINDVTAEHDGLSGTIKIITSQQVVATNLSSFIKLDPAVKFNVEVADDGFLVRSDNFDVTKSYQISILKGLRGRIGGLLGDNYINNIAFGQLEPSISFVNSKGVYLSDKGLQNLEVKIVNVEKLKVVISKIYENNLLAAQRFGYHPKESSVTNNTEEDYEEDNDGDINFGDVIYEQEIDTRSLQKYGNSRLFNFNVTDRLPDFKGIYHIMIRSAKDYWVKDGRFISLSDIGLIAREGKEKIIVFANSIKQATAIPGVNIIAYGGNNQVLGMGSTNAEGVAEIPCSKKEFAGFRPAMLIAKTAEDFNYLPFSQTRVNTSKFEVGGKRNNSTGLDAFIYPERDIYRPGEKVNFSVIIRDREWNSPGDIPVKMKFLLPNGKELKTFRKSLNEQGSLDEAVEINSAAITGTYSLEVYTSNDVLLATQSFHIEEFVPDRIKVAVKVDKDFLIPGDLSSLSIHATNFFGPPAAGRKYECEIQVKQKSFDPKNYEKYNFSLANQNSFFDKIVREGKTDEKGDAIEKYEVKEVYKNMGLLQAVFYATVFDETGRPVSRNTIVDIFTQNIFFGIADDGYSYHPLNQQAQFQLIALDKNGKLLNGIAKVEVIKHEYRTVLSKNGSYFRYESQNEDKLIASSDLAVSGENTHYSFVPRSPGEYELRLYIPGSNNYVRQSFYSYGTWGTDNTSFEVNNEGHIDIELDKSSYYTGEKVKALFKAPFNGRMLVTMETDRVNYYQYVDITDKRTALIELPLDKQDIPNVYITATLFKPHGISEIPLTVAHGYSAVKVEEKERRMPVEIISGQSVRSKTKQLVKIKASPNSLVTLAAVDNGVLQITDFETPDPYNHFYAKRALEVDGYDIYPLLFPEINLRLSSTGGDVEADMKKRVNPMPAKRFKIVSYWSGIKRANENGEADFEFGIPQFSGELRLMAVAYGNESFGSKEAKITVADPIVVSMALPRFLSPKDTVSVPVTVTNTTSKSTTAIAILKTSGAVKKIGPDKQTLNLLPNSESQVLFRVEAASLIGVGKLLVEINGLGEKFTNETEISVRPSSSLEKISGSGSIQGGASQQVLLTTNDFIPSSIDYKLVLSRSPVAELTKYFNYLVEYPFGCTEQVVSSAFPQLYFGEMADRLQKNPSVQTTANFNVQEAIRKIKMRQLYNGAVTLWDNEDSENWWATIYSAHFLWEAQRSGFDVDNGLMETLLGYIDNKLKNRETITYYYNRNKNKKIAPKEVLYGLYILALTGRPNVSVMNYYKSNPALLSLDAKYLLSASYALSGDKKRFGELLPVKFEGEESEPQTGGSFYSDIRDESLALNVLEEVDPGNPQIPVMVRHVVDKLKKRSWYSTQELVFSFVALGKIARESAKSNVTADIKINGKTVALMSGSDLQLAKQQLKGTTVEIRTSGQGKLYYFWESEGISENGNYTEVDNYLKVRKKFFDRNGRILSGDTFKQNDLVIVQLTLEKSYNTDIDNIVITDILPAGFEIENPRTKEIPGMDWIKADNSPTAMDIRDDRINLFVDAHNGKQTYYYALRVVSPGVYHMGPVSADAMYNGEYHSYNGARIIKVIQ
jgi:alpha-2-macroglobulin